MFSRLAMSKTSDNNGIGEAGAVPALNTFEFCVSQPFIAESPYTPASQIVPRIEDSRPIFIDHKSGRALTFGQISSDALTIASGLLSLGLDPNHIYKLPPTSTCLQGPEIAPVVLIQLPNNIAFAPILLGTFAAGLTATLVSPALTSDELGWILQNAHPRAIITTSASLPAMLAAINQQTDHKEYYHPPPSTATPSSPLDWKALLAPSLSSPSIPFQIPFPLSPTSTPSRTAVILWSSGTSGRSKGVLLSHAALNFSMASLWHDMDSYLGQRQRWLGYVPFYHVFGLCTVLLMSIAAGAAVYTMPSFNLDVMLAAVPKLQITYLHMAPPIAVMLAKAPAVEKHARIDPRTGKNAFGSVVGAVTGGAPCGHEVVVQVYNRLGFRIKLGYGLSETCSTALQRGLSEAEMHAHAGDTGKPHWGVEVVIAAAAAAAAAPSDNGAVTKSAPLDTEGEILIRSPSVMTAYLPIGLFTDKRGGRPDMAATTDALTPDGFFRTGDVGTVNDGGRVRITDRLKELIKVRAYQVAPAELEAALCSSDKVADAGVIGVYDADEATEWPRAFVVPAGGVGVKNMGKAAIDSLAQELKGLVEKRTAKYKWLIGGIVFVDQIPKSPSGKILRRVLRDQGAGAGGGVEVALYVKKKRGGAKL
ncbi:hypothetical protein B0T17DRAFT_543487 [Bombardia bombarda]|uniref:4-coumarate--CoA ligase n=1 Tax=Bombardia bombarda TaxID=252184 RepID=A0AA39TTX2_9PEZI|nr:hypothetical protein B0T17DRAFT_543487 [Bombardia bombarda]